MIEQKEKTRKALDMLEELIRYIIRDETYDGGEPDWTGYYMEIYDLKTDIVNLLSEETE